MSTKSVKILLIGGFEDSHSTHFRYRQIRIDLITLTKTKQIPYPTSEFQRVLDHENWIMDISDPESRTPKFEKTYSALEEYSLPDMSPTSMYNLAQRIEAYDSLWETFIK